jgi:hypothetical protein
LNLKSSLNLDLKPYSKEKKEKELENPVKKKRRKQHSRPLSPARPRARAI